MSSVLQRHLAKRGQGAASRITSVALIVDKVRDVLRVYAAACGKL